MSSMTKFGVGVLLLFGAWKLFLAPSRIQVDVPYPLQYRTQIVGAASGADRLPLLIALHGAGANEKDLDGVFADFTTPVRVVSFRGPERSGSGYVWSRGQGATQQEARAEQEQMFREVADSIALGATEIAARFSTEGKPMVFGFSRGASMAWYLGVHHPERFDAIFAVAGELDEELLEGLAPARRPPFFAYHGRKDPVVGMHRGQRTAEAIERLAGRVSFEEFDGGHTVPLSVREDVERQIRNLRGS
ncbi:MAG: hypothetical protein GY723_13065 [bacterium]|nr:hypothetical protein [bacterium]